MPWWIWILVAVILGIIELVSTTFVLMWIALAAAVTAILTGFLPELWLQVLVFAVASAVLLAATRPLVRRWRSVNTIPQPLERLVGQTGVVVTPAVDGGFATVRIQGELWSAASDHPLDAGMHVRVVRAQSSVLKVEPVLP